MPAFLLTLLTEALAAPQLSAGAGLTAATTGPFATLSARAHLDSSLQVGVYLRGQQVSGAFIDGWPVTEGTATSGLLGLTLPLVAGDALRLDVEVESGLRTLQATQTQAEASQSLTLIADLGPVATLAVQDGLAIRLGWMQLTHLQVQPGSALDAQGSLLRGGVVFAPTPDLQLAIDGQTGGVFGFDGDGGKYLAQVGAQVRWVPGAAASWTNH